MLAVSPQDVESHERFAAQEGFEFPMLADTDMSAGREWGIVAGKLYRRSVFVVDRDNVIRFRNVKLVGATWKTARDLAAELERLD